MQQRRISTAIANAFPDHVAPHLLALLLMAASGSLLAAETLPELAEPGKSGMNFRPGPGRLSLDSNDSTRRFTAQAETSQHTGLSLGVRGAWQLTDRFVFGGGAQLGGRMSEFYANLGLRLTPSQRLMLTGGQLRQKLEFDFPSGKSRAEMTQNSGGLSWRMDLGDGMLDHAELNAYTARTASRDLSDATYAIETAALYELWNDPRRIAGGRIGGVQGKVGMKPWQGGRVSLGLGHETLRYDLLAGAETRQRATASLGVEHALNRQTRLKFGADAAAAQNRYQIGLDHRFDGLGILGINLLNLQGRDGAPGDTRVQLSLTLPLGSQQGAAAANHNTHPSAANPNAPAPRHPAAPQTTHWGGNLLDQVAARPAWMPSQVIAKRDTTATQTRLVVVDKTALPAGAAIDPATGAITVPLGVAVTSIAGITRNVAAFVNTGQFALSGNNLVIDPQRIEQPAVGATDVYVVTVNNAGGGTTNVTVNVQRGSVKIVSIVIAYATDTTPDAFTFTDVTGQALSTVVESNAITVAGINAAAAISVTGGEYQINGGAWTSAAGTVTNGQTVKVRHTTSGSNSTATNTTLTIGGVSDTFTTTTLAGLPAGYISQGGLIWSPNNATVSVLGYAKWNAANTFCTTQTINGQTGWRLPTTAELVALYHSGALSGQGWALNRTWSSTPRGAGSHESVRLNDGLVGWLNDAYNYYVSCVR